tara:strand:- start:493 stop:894 length:402 start_codon:yes stop_codon:yes gene_type:complete
MSTLKVNTIQNTSAAHSSTPEQIEQGRAKAWINFNGSGTIAINDSFNVSSITDNGTGDYTISYTTAMASVNYCGVGGGKGDNDGTDANKTVTSFKRISSTPAAGSSRVVTGFGNNAGTATNSIVVTWVVFGDQ